MSDHPSPARPRRRRPFSSILLFVLAGCAATPPQVAVKPQPAFTKAEERARDDLKKKLARPGLGRDDLRREAATAVEHWTGRSGPRSLFPCAVGLTAAEALLARDDPGGAEKIARAAKSMAERRAGRKGRAVALAARVLGDILLVLRDPVGAREAFREARRILELTDGVTADLALSNRLREARMAIELNDLAGAERLLAGLSDTHYEPAAQIERMFIAVRRGAIGQARLHQSQAMSLFRERNDARTIAGLETWLWLRLDDDLELLDPRWKSKGFLQARTAALLGFGHDKLTQTRLLTFLAKRWARLDPPRAADYFAQAERAWTELRDGVFSGASEETRFAFAGEVGRFFEDYVAFKLAGREDTPEAAAEVLRLIAAGRGALLDEAFRTIRQAPASGARGSKAKRETLLAAIAAGYLALQRADTYIERGRVSVRLQRLEAELMEAQDRPNKGRPRPKALLSLKRICSAMTGRGALVVFFQYRSGRQLWLGRISLDRKGCQPSFSAIGPLAPVLEPMHRLARHLRAPFSSSSVTNTEIGGSAKTIEGIVSTLGPTLWKGTTSLQGPLYIYWDPNLPQVPLELLPSPAGPGPLVRHAAVTYLATLGSLKRTKPKRGRGAALFGAPDYGPVATRGRPRRAGQLATRGCIEPGSLHRFVATPGMSDEIKRINVTLGRHKVNVTVRTGDAAREAAFRKDSAGKRFVLVTTHGYFLGGECSAAAGTRGLVLDPKATPLAGAKRPARQAITTLYQRRIAAVHPLLRAGLTFAGANLTGDAAGTDDGHLTALEASGLDLRTAELVILSACETGVGERVHNEGVMGLSRAFLVAGASGVGMSLWSVSDVETTELITHWVKRVMAGDTVAEALRRAKLHLMETLVRRDGVAHPYFWAAFQYTQ